MLQYGCRFVTDWHAHPRLDNTAWDGWRMWILAVCRREKGTFCALRITQAIVQAQACGGFISLTLSNCTSASADFKLILFPGHHNNMSCCTLILQGKIHTGCSASGKATLFWKGDINATFIKGGRANKKHIQRKLPKAYCWYVSYYILVINLGGTSPVFPWLLNEQQINKDWASQV